MELRAGSKSERGPRALNQDHAVLRQDLGLFLVADGMGGHNAGEVASKLAAQAIVDFIEATAEGPVAEFTWPFETDPARSYDANRLGAAVRLANRKVFDESAANEAFRGMGTTVVAALAHGDKVVLASVGDSRIYRWRAGALERMTDDDTWLTAVFGKDRDLSDSGHPLRHVLTSVVGTRGDLRPSLREETLMDGDLFLLCSDGVHGRLDATSIASILAGSRDPRAAAEQLVFTAISRGTTDNSTAVVFQAAEPLGNS
jgi:protein phosphatase